MSKKLEGQDLGRLLPKLLKRIAEADPATFQFQAKDYQSGEFYPLGPVTDFITRLFAVRERLAAEGMALEGVINERISSGQKRNRGFDRILNMLQIQHHIVTTWIRGEARTVFPKIPVRAVLAIDRDLRLGYTRPKPEPKPNVTVVGLIIPKVSKSKGKRREAAT